ncbi:MAG: glutamyl-tRNA reductase [Prolixibacteraceae bacterium]|jgi:glutamyl-tRNA reductase|nr:glutamyl-tRNA reductase [Prolixibacteraceae bacterium]
MIGLLGLNHKSAPIEVRERFVFCEEDIKRFIPLLQLNGVSGAIVLSTCNRTEIYYEMNELLVPLKASDIENLLFSFRKADMEVRKYFYHKENEAVAAHLFHVGSGLDSMALGEYQIVGQIKTAVQISKTNKLISCVLSKLFDDALKAGKQVRTETALNKGAVSISYAGVELASKKLHHLSTHPVLLVGAGQTSELTIRNLIKKSCSLFTIVNRTREKAEELAEKYHAKVAEMDHLSELLLINDIVITSTASKRPFFSAEMVQEAMVKRSGKPLFFIDLSVPRNVAMEVGALEHVHVYDVDALNHVIENNLDKRKGEIFMAEQMIEASVAEFMKWFNIRALAPTFKTISTSFQEASKNVLDGIIKNREAEEYEKALEYGDLITKKLIGMMIENIKSVTDNGSNQAYITVVNQLFAQE